MVDKKNELKGIWRTYLTAEVKSAKSGCVINFFPATKGWESLRNSFPCSAYLHDIKRMYRYRAIPVGALPSSSTSRATTATTITPHPQNEEYHGENGKGIT